VVSRSTGGTVVRVDEAAEAVVALDVADSCWQAVVPEVAVAGA
jgi:hypothetical protein